MLAILAMRAMGGKLEVVRLYHRVVQRFRHPRPAHFLAVWRSPGTDEAALPRQRLDHALAFELRVGLGHRVAIDAQLLGQRPNRGQRITGSNRAGGDGGFT
jgi:hypothetical protein